MGPVLLGEENKVSNRVIRCCTAAACCESMGSITISCGRAAWHMVICYPHGNFCICPSCYGNVFFLIRCKRCKHLPSPNLNCDAQHPPSLWSWRLCNLAQERKNTIPKRAGKKKVWWFTLIICWPVQFHNTVLVIANVDSLFWYYLKPETVPAVQFKKIVSSILDSGEPHQWK